MSPIELDLPNLNVNVEDQINNPQVFLFSEPEITVNVQDDINNTRVILRQPSTFVSQNSPYINAAESALTASFALVAGALIGAVQLSGSIIVEELTVNNNVYVTGSITGGSFNLNAGAVNLTFTGSVTSGIFGATEYVEPPFSANNYSGVSVEYIARRDGSVRMGMLMSTWLSGSIVFTDVSTVDIGDTSDLTFSFVEVGSDIRLRVYSAGSGSGAWSVQSLFKLFPI